jgi:hypothetical protein
MTNPVTGTTSKGTGGAIDDGLGSRRDRHRLLRATKTATSLGESTRGGALLKTLGNLDTLVFIGRKVVTKGK